MNVPNFIKYKKFEIFTFAKLLHKTLLFLLIYKEKKKRVELFLCFFSYGKSQLFSSLQNYLLDEK